MAQTQGADVLPVKDFALYEALCAALAANPAGKSGWVGLSNVIAPVVVLDPSPVVWTWKSDKISGGAQGAGSSSVILLDTVDAGEEWLMYYFAVERATGDNTAWKPRFRYAGEDAIIDVTTAAAADVQAPLYTPTPLRAGTQIMVELGGAGVAVSTFSTYLGYEKRTV